MKKAVATGLMLLGALGWLSHFYVISIATKRLDRAELPNSLASARVTSPDGRVFIASEPFARVQRYGPQGFELGFQVASQGGAFELGVSPEGEVQICSARGKVLFTYSADGSAAKELGPCEFNVSHNGLLPRPSYLVYASDAKVPAIASSWLATLAIPLWHPFVSWVMFIAGGLWLNRLRASP